MMLSCLNVEGEEEGEILGTRLKLAVGQVDLII